MGLRDILDSKINTSELMEKGKKFIDETKKDLDTAIENLDLENTLEKYEKKIDSSINQLINQAEEYGINIKSEKSDEQTVNYSESDAKESIEDNINPEISKEEVQDSISNGIVWEYYLLEETNENKLVEKLNELGKEDWEAVKSSLAIGSVGRAHHYVLLKHQKN